MSSLKLSVQDKRDLEKFTRFLALKASQIIVQSRSGDKFSTKCKPNSSGTDWFNLAIQDLPEVLTEAKRALSEQIFSCSVPLCIEISLKTIEGDTMVLEVWMLGVIPEHSDNTIRVTYTVYNRMAILLKSLLSVSRVTPAYKLSRRQGSDSYVICYRIFMGEPQLHNLGDNYKHVRIGQLCTPVGLIHLSVSYRTKMTISPTQTDRGLIMLKSDHFHADLSPQHAPNHNNEDSLQALSDTIKLGAFVANKQFLINQEDGNSDIPFGSLLSVRQKSSSPIFSSGIDKENPTENAKIQITPMMTIPRDVSYNRNGNKKLTNDNMRQKYASQTGSRINCCSMLSANDDFVLVDLKTPFAETSAKSDLGTFYRDCQSAPPLQTFREDRTLAEQFGDITKQLEAFETNMYLFEDLIKSLRTSENND